MKKTGFDALLDSFQFVVICHSRNGCESRFAFVSFDDACLFYAARLPKDECVEMWINDNGTPMLL